MIRNSERAGSAAEIPDSDQKQLRPDDSTRAGGSSASNQVTRVVSNKRMEIRPVKGRLKVVETE
jgi:hypothetical protein